jgi:chemotaxis protein methyltransferase WspC
VTASAIENVVREQLGLDPAALGQNVLERAVETRMRVRRLNDPGTYALRLITEATERDALASELAVSETWFFRGGRSLFDRLTTIVSDRAENRAIGSAVRVLSVPCSTGEEPYSLAIALHERFLTPDDFRIDAVDISPRALSKASLARYGVFAFRESGSDLRPIYFRRSEDAWELLSHLRAVVRFMSANLTEPNFLANERPYDVILCRNLFIYLTPDARLRAMTNIDRLLALEGRLCITPAEADRLPPGRFVLDGPTEFGIYRRVGAGNDAVSPSPPTRSAERSDLPLKGGGQYHTSPLEGEVAADFRRESRRVGGEGERERQTPAPGATPFPTARTISAARLLADAGQLDEARAICEQLLRASAADVDALALLGVIHLAAAREDDAFKAFRKVLYLMPDHVEAVSHMVGLCERRGDAAHAAAMRRRLARLKKE